MLEPGEAAPDFILRTTTGSDWRLYHHGIGRPALLVFLEADCPTCHLSFPYLNRMSEVAGREVNFVGISQDPAAATQSFIDMLDVRFPVLLDSSLEVSRRYDPLAVPTLFLLDGNATIVDSMTGFNKSELNRIAGTLAELAGSEPFVVAEPFDGAPDSKFGCASRHLESTGGAAVEPVDLYSTRGARASRIELAEGEDPWEYSRLAFGDPLPVLPPTAARVERMLAAVDDSPDSVIARIPPNYGVATVEKIAANAVMAGCEPSMMRVLLPLVRAVCDERFNIHGVQATTHFAAPLIIINGPIRAELGFVSGSNAFSNVSRANSTLGRALQLILINLGGARPGKIDMSTLGNPGKFSFCIAENEEQNPWEPLHVEMGFERHQSTLTLFACEPPHGVSEHYARDGRQLLLAISRVLVTVFSYRMCAGVEAMVVLCPEHVKTLKRDGFTKAAIRKFLHENTGVPKREFDLPGEGAQMTHLYREAVIDGEPCYLKFPDADSVKIVVAGGTAGKFSAVLGSWAAGARGSQMVTYPIP